MRNELRIITDIVCDYFKQDPDLILSKTRKRDIVEIRQVCHYFGRSIMNGKRSRYSLSTVAWDIGKKDHATALYSDRVVRDRMKIYKCYNKDIENLQYKIDIALVKDYFDVEKEGYIIRYHKFRGLLK